MVLRPAKAFLCYSSSDNSFVNTVALDLGRQFCLYDEYILKTGDDLKRAIRAALDEATVFVLFASRDSLASIWVNFELDEAEQRQVRGVLARSLVLRLDGSIRVDELPPWLRQVKIGDAISSKSSARQIRHALLDVMRQLRHPFLVGRTDELRHVEEALLPVDGRTTPHILHVFGLDGIGRRTIVAEVAKNVLRLNSLLVISVEDGDSPQEVALKIADLVEPYSTQEGFQAMAKEIGRLSSDEAVARSVADMRVACSLGEMPTLLDSGGILDKEGNFPSFVGDLFRAIDKNGGTYLTCLTRRSLSDDEVKGVGVIPTIAIPPMEPEDVKRLLTLLTRAEDVSIPLQALPKLAERVRGLPPNAYFTVQLIKHYGVEVLLADDLRIAELSLRTFREYLSSIGLDAAEVKLLRTLATHSPLPIAVLAEVAKLGVKDMSDRVCRMIDFSVILVNKDGTYSASPPLLEAILREFGYFSTSEHDQVASALDDYLKEEEDGQRRLDLGRVLFRALTLSKTERGSERAVALASDWIRMARDAYHTRDYETAADLGSEAVKIRPGSTDAWSYLIRALVHLERWDNAETGIASLKKQKELPEAYFLTGFLERKRGRLHQARDAFKRALELGRRGVSVYRELAYCLFRLGDLGACWEAINQAETYRENSYVVDLKVQIATELRDEKSAREGLARLKVLEAPSYYNHRKSVVEAAFGNPDEAYQAARLAWTLADRPPFEVLAQLVYCEIATKRFDEATGHLVTLEKRFHYTRQDIRTGLRCRLEIERGEVADALVIWEKLRDKSKPVHQALRRDILEALLPTNPPEPFRTQYREELQALRKLLADTRPAFELG